MMMFISNFIVLTSIGYLLSMLSFKLAHKSISGTYYIALELPSLVSTKSVAYCPRDVLISKRTTGCCTGNHTGILSST